ncbi:hypothetical protein [Deinococcus radiotolerans]|uniref:Uncharacterized protein n=1 Tax=Deinococcus radiotolerans TaxID=1309407 RepID=A0ABQ2FM16_9DEIO|nr:hypothetical protein [Deinococcus radiotolerans]GGL06023.1 hypothetical protein GCM10010844_25960 [Deinococcus radiotolerans]
MSDDNRHNSAGQSGLPADAGNGMSDRSAQTDVSDSGMSETDTVTAHVTDGQDQADTQTPATGTTFGTTGNDDTRQ